MKWKAKQLDKVRAFFAIVPHYCLSCKCYFWLMAGFYKTTSFDLAGPVYKFRCIDCGPQGW